MEKYVITSNEIINFTLKLYIFLLDKAGRHEQLNVKGSIVMDDSAIIRFTRIQNDGNDVISAGYITKFLDEQNWWNTQNHLVTKQSNEIWVSALCI